MFQDEARFGRINDPKRFSSGNNAYGAVSPRDGAADFTMTAVAMKVFLDESA